MLCAPSKLDPPFALTAAALIDGLVFGAGAGTGVAVTTGGETGCGCC
jgi:hypothetical protein